MPRNSILSLPQALSLAHSLTHARWEGLARVSTLDGHTHTCVVIDADTGALVDEAPVGTGATQLDAVGHLLDQIHELNVRDVLAELLNAPAAVTLAPELLAEDADALAPAVDATEEAAG